LPPLAVSVSVPQLDLHAPVTTGELEDRVIDAEVGPQPAPALAVNVYVPVVALLRVDVVAPEIVVPSFVQEKVVPEGKVTLIGARFK
jgi:hypothetical protein